MFKKLLKYFFLFLVVTINIENIVKSDSIGERLFVLAGMSFLIYLIFKLSNLPEDNVRNSTFSKKDKIGGGSTIESLNNYSHKTLINNQLNSFLLGKRNIFWVGDEHRTHPWSIRPGGCTVVVVLNSQYEDGIDCLGYDKVKRPYEYTNKITQDFISNHTSNFHFDNIENYISDIFIKTEHEYKLNHVWHSNMGGSLKEILDRYRVY